MPELVTLIERPARSLKPGGKGAKGKRKAGRRIGVGGGFGMGRNNSIASHTVATTEDQSSITRSLVTKASTMINTNTLDFKQLMLENQKIFSFYIFESFCIHCETKI